MTAFGHKMRRLLLPLAVFLGVAAAHYVWSGLFPEVDPAQARWASIPWGRGFLLAQSLY